MKECHANWKTWGWVIIQYSSTLMEMFGLKVFALQTCQFANAFEYRKLVCVTRGANHSKLSRAFPKVGSVFAWSKSVLSSATLQAFSVCPQARPPYPCYLDLLMKHTSHMTTNKQRMEPRCFCHGQMCGAWHTMRVEDGTRGNRGDGIVEAPWSGQDWQWSLWEGFACSKQPRNLVVFSARGGLRALLRLPRWNFKLSFGS